MLRNDFHRTALGAIVIVSASVFAPASYAAIGYSQDFEAMIPNQQTQPNDLSDDGWLVGANVFDGETGDFLYDYFAFPAPNGGPAFSAVVTGEGSPTQGENQLSVYSDYNNLDHGAGNLIEALVFRDIGVLADSDVGKTYNFTFDGKQGNLVAPTTAFAYLRVLKTSDGSFALLANETVDTTNLGPVWNDLELSVLIDPTFAGETLQIGFGSVATNYDGSGVFYDNLNVVIPIPAAVWLFGSGLLGLVALGRRRKNGNA